MIFKNSREFYYDYEMPLVRAMHEVEKRGLLVDPTKLAQLDSEIGDMLRIAEDRASVLTGKKCKAGAGADVNLNSPAQIIKLLETRGLKIPTKRGTNKPTTGADVLERMYAQTGDEVIRQVLNVRELTKIRGTYVRTELLDNVLYCTYVVPGTKGGRRSSRANFLGLGTNHQNFPKHSVLGERYRSCIVARPGKIFISCDQKSAEDWIINGLIADLTGVDRGIQALRGSVSRHTLLACFIFALPQVDCGKASLHYYLAKKTRYAGSYGMRGARMSAALAAEGYHIPEALCTQFLIKFHKAEPEIEQVFQRYVETELLAHHMLHTPIGRTRVFLDLRPGSDNQEVFRDGYSYIPQSTVGDNTGLGILYCERHLPGSVVADAHDAIVLEVDDNDTSIRAAAHSLESAFDREIVFDNGYTLKIPVEVEVGHNLNSKEMVSCDDFSSLGLTHLLATLRSAGARRQQDSTSGQQSQQLLPA